MELPFINSHNFQSLLMKCKTLLKKMSLSLKQNSVSKNMLIIVSILVVFVLLNFWLIVIAVVCFALGRWSINYNKRQNESLMVNSRHCGKTLRTVRSLKVFPRKQVKELRQLSERMLIVLSGG